ncbi:hypothetical protein NCAS_0G01530 [Naumovozyma castellii]|uniref:Uncharacterized protein n=1 Tax=Naumovozyma castellii TaxID=27288 RepID=G0VI06_NAUCA|nr:hypothetical protein NCAS_0G01530 [Naumovozyma castellii CBS 4309]CCC71040.1 hypothetical protein NCAS_0G01530 [Naumovozyma castellii CBS 4309]
MRNRPRNIQEWFYYTLLESPAFHRFVGKVYRRVNGIKDIPPLEHKQTLQFLYKPTKAHKINAFKMLFIDEYRATFGLPKKTDKYLN